MYSAYRLAVTWMVLSTTSFISAQSPVIRVCADANNMPFSNSQQQGFENKLAEIVASALGRQLQYIWWPPSPMRSARMFQKGVCDLIMGMPLQSSVAMPTRAYYRSTYVFVTRKDRDLALKSFDDPKLHLLRIGLPLIQGDGTPPEQELEHRGIVRNVVGYSIFGDLSKPNPPQDLLKAVSKGEVDVGIAWGPLAGYFAQSSSVPLAIHPICQSPNSKIPLTFSISMGVRHGDTTLRNQLNSEIERRHREIRSLLRSYGVPLVDPRAGAKSCR